MRRKWQHRKVHLLPNITQQQETARAPPLVQSHSLHPSPLGCVSFTNKQLKPLLQAPGRGRNITEGVCT